MKARTEVLQKAKELIDTPEKWGQGIDDLCDGKICAALAIGRVARRDTTKDFGWAFRVGDVIKFFGQQVQASSVAEWNDVPGRTHAEVMSAFDLAIKNSEEK